VRLGLYSYLRKPFEYEDLLADVVGASRRLKKRTSRELPVVEQIREPLASASSLLEALRLDEDLLPDNAQSTLELALESLQSAEDVVVEQEIEQKLRSRQADLRPLNLVQTLRATVQPLTELSRAERAPIWLEVDQEVQVVADPSLLPRMLQTILEMVIRVSAFGRPLMMDLEQAGSRVTLQIIGQGGTVAQLRQVNPRALTMCEQLARLQGGQVTIQPYLVDVGVSCQIELAVAGG